MPTDIEKGVVGNDTTAADAGAENRNRDSSTIAPESPESSTAPSEIHVEPLKQTSTVLTTRSAREAAKQLQNFDTSPDNGRNWPVSKKWGVCLTVTVTGFISTSASSIAVPGIHDAMAEFGVHNLKIGVLITSFYVLGLGTGPFVFAPISELWGRQVAYLSSQFCFFLFAIGAACAPNMAGLIVLRFFCGAMGSVGPTLGVATCADLFAPNERGLPVSVYAVGPMAGPVLGSMLGYWILFGGWRWELWFMVIASGLNTLLLVFFSQETYAPVIQRKLGYRIKYPQTDASGLSSRFSPRRIAHNLGWMSAMVSRAEASDAFYKAFTRPPRLLFGNPVAFLTCVYYSYLYSIIYMFLIGTPMLFGPPPFKVPGLFSYEWPRGTLALAYVGSAIGFGSAALTAATQQDRIYKYLARKNGDNGQPEYRFVLTQIGSILLPIGLFIFGWTAQAQTHWIGPAIGQTILSFGCMLAFNSIQNFLVDAFFPYHAAATAAASATRSVFACVLPIFCAQMFGTLKWGWGGSLLAFIAIAAIPCPLIMFKYGKRLRERYKFKG